MKWILSLLSLYIVPVVSAPAQAGELWIQTGDKGLYLEHKVMPKEGLFPLGRMYNVHPRHIANYNGLDFNKGLVLGQLIKIPLTDTNFNQKTNAGVPVLYKVGEKEGLLKISTAHKKVAVENLRAWNKLNSDNVDFGSAVIVGFLVSKEMKPGAVPVVKSDPVKETKAPPANDEKKEDVKPTVKEVRDYAEIPDARKDVIQTVEMKQPEKKPEIISAVKIETAAEGFFKWHFEQQLKQQPASNDKTVTAGIFKTTSGWSDGKYYLLMDGVQPGTIVRITNPVNNNTVFAKVLGQMEGISLNKGLDIRISNAASAKLGVTETDKFIVKLNY
jgi:hypothetical protein